MCCTIGEVETHLTNTRIYVGEAMKNDKLVHVLAYQNKAESANGVPNAMILPFPTSQKMGQDNVLNTEKYKDFLDNITDASQRHTKSARRSLGVDSVDFDLDERAEVFDVGSYTVILAEHVSQVPEALNRVAIEKRPKVSRSFLAGFAELYPNQPVALCCWAGGQVLPEPLLWWYEPTDPENLFIPTMDAHDGGPPNLDAMVDTDHIISVGSAMHPMGSPVSYRIGYVESRLPTHAASLLPTRVYGHRPGYRSKNGDSFVSVANLRSSTKTGLYTAGTGVMIKRGVRLHKATTSPLVTHSEQRMDGWIA